MNISFSKFFFLFLLLIPSAFSYSKLQNEYIFLEINSKNNPNTNIKIGPKGTFGLISDTKRQGIFNHSDIEEETKFVANFINNPGLIALLWECRLWAPESMNIVVLCETNGTLKNNTYYYLSDGRFSSGNLDFYISSHEYESELFLLDYGIPFIYSDIQYINLDEQKGSYELKFKYDFYDNQKLFLTQKDKKISYTDFDKCYKDEKELICEISRKKVEAIYTSNTTLSLTLINGQYGLFDYEFVSEIKIIANQPKEEIILETIEALNKDSETGSLIAFKTNITDISPLTTNKFDIDVIADGKEDFISCFLKKYDNEETPLLLMCENQGKNYDFQIKKDLRPENISYKYNFIIKGTDFFERITFKGSSGKKIIFNSPEIMDFTKSDQFTIQFFVEGMKGFDYIKFSKDAPFLECKTENYIKTCIVNRSHFDGMETGSFYPYYSNNYTKDTIAYDAQPFKVIIEPNVIINIKLEDNKDIKIGLFDYEDETEATLPLITDFDDSEQNIFNISDIEEKTTFTMRLLDHYGSERYFASCRLWKPKNDKIRLFCNIDGINYLKEKISFNRVSFKYKEYTIIIKAEGYFEVEQCDEPISFLYSDEQNINLEEEEESYILKFKYDSYKANEVLYLYSGSNYLPINNCEKREKEISCKINKILIEENLFKQGKFKLGALNEYCGTISLNSVLGININYNKTIEKQNINVSISYPFDTSTKAGQAFIYRTYSRTVENIITDKFPMKFLYNGTYNYYYCYLKKNGGNNNNLVLICSIPLEGDYLMVEQDIELSDIHYKYNFILNKLYDNLYIEVKGLGTQIHFTYPNILNLTLEESISFRYIMDNPNLSGDIIVGQDDKSTEILKCANRGDILKTCTVPISFFDGKKDGYYYTYHISNSENTSAILYYDSTPFYFILPKNNLIIMRLKENYNYRLDVGQNGFLCFTTDYIDNKKNAFNDTHLEDNFSFNASIIDKENNIYEMICKLWNPKNNYMRIFCNLKQKLKNKGKFSINEVSFEYNSYNVLIIPECNPYIIQDEYNYPFIYYEEQVVELEEEKDIYELEFNVISYNKSFLYLYGYNNYIPLDDCKILRKKLFCSIKKDILLENLISLNDKLTLYSFDDSLGRITLDSVLGVYVTSKESIIKENIYVKIDKLLCDVNEYPSYIAYETNVSSIADLFTKEFYHDYYFGNNETSYNGYCLFRKNSQNNLLFLCNLIGKGDKIHLMEFTTPKLLNDIHYKYNFIIVPIINNETFTYAYGPFGSKVIRVFPNIIDLRFKDSVNVLYYFEYGNNVGDIRLRPDLPNLECKYKLSFYNCTIPLSYFKNQSSGYYYTYHTNHKDMLIKYYEANPFEVLLPEEDKVIIRIKKEYNREDIVVGKINYIYFVTDYDDEEYNIFDYDKDAYGFKTNIVENEILNFETNCRIWRPMNSKIRIFCLEPDLIGDGIHNIKLSTTELSFNKHKIILYSQDEVKINILEKIIIPFYYSSPQEIVIQENITEYELKFNYISYTTGDLLYLNGEIFNTADLFKHCAIRNKQLVCSITKDKIEELLSRNNEQFKLGLLLENYGTFVFENALNITVNYNITNKENIYINQLKLLDNVSEVGSVIAYETNIIDIPNFNTIEFGSCRFYKDSLNPLLMLCTPDREGDSYFGNITKEIELDFIHYKYNIIIEPLENYDIFNIEGKGTQIKMVYPKILNLTVDEYVEVNYIMDFPELAQGIKLNPDSENLKCEDLTGMKKCIVPLNHFDGKENGYYYAYHSNHLKGLSKFYNSLPVYVILPPDNLRVLRIKLEDNKNKIQVGLNGTLYFTTNYDDTENNIFNASDIEERTYFETYVRDQQGFHFDVKCRLWKPNYGNIKLLCDLEKSLRNTEQIITVNSATFKYNNYTIYISSKEGINVTQLSNSIPFIYSDKQEIDIKEGIDSYIFKFKTTKYQNELLYIYHGLSYIILYNCKKEKKDLTCELSRSLVEDNLVLFNNTGNFKLAYLDDGLGSITLYSVLDIKIKSILPQKEEIYISVTKLLNKVSESGMVVGYQTNITYIQNLKTNLFMMPFYDLIYDVNAYGYCYFKKSNGDNTLLFLCNIIGEGYFFALETENNTILNDIHYKYNFILSPIEIANVIRISDFGTEVQLTYPTLLNFTIEEKLTIKYVMPLPFLASNIKLNPDSSPLECNYSTEMLKCDIPLSHFSGKENGYYYTYHSNHLNGFSIYYDSTPFNVILPNDYTIVIRIKTEENTNIKVGTKGTLYFETNYNDTTKNVFNISNIEEMTKFKTSAIDLEENIYNDIICRLWKTKGRNLRLFCNLKEDFKFEEQYIKLNEVSFNYTDYIIVVRFEDAILVNQLNYTIPFIYSDNQEIIIKEDVNTYELIFNFDLFNNDTLALFCDNSGYNFFTLERIEIKENKLICYLEKDKLDDILYNEEKFKLYSINDIYGLSPLNLVFDIIIQYEFSEKRNIYIKINNLLSDYSLENSFIAYETKYNGKISNIKTNLFRLTFNYNESETTELCYFKKADGHDLILLCYINYNGEYYLKKIDNEIVLDNIHNKYNFIILPMENNKTIYVNQYYGNFVLFNYPSLLNFTLEDSLYIRYIINWSSEEIKIKLNPDSTDLECTDISHLRKCIVPLSHFINKKSGYYLTHYSTGKNNISMIYYEATPFKVILPPDDLIVLRIKQEYNKDDIKIGSNNTLYLKTDYEDAKNIFDIDDIENKTYFEGTIKDTEENIYNIVCNLKKKISDNMFLFCRLNEKLKYDQQSIILDISSFSYKNYTVIIYQKDYINAIRLE